MGRADIVVKGGDFFAFFNAVADAPVEHEPAGGVNLIFLALTACPQHLGREPRRLRVDLLKKPTLRGTQRGCFSRLRQEACIVTHAGIPALGFYHLREFF